MERLTFEGNFCDIAQCANTPGGSYCESGSCSQREVWERLKQYGDTGLTPKDCAEYRKFKDEIIARGKTRLVELLQADKEGRVLVLPCNKKDVEYGGYIANVEKKYLENAKEALAEHAALCLQHIMLYQDMFTVDGDTVKWKLWICPDKSVKEG